MKKFYQILKSLGSVPTDVTTNGNAFLRNKRFNVRVDHQVAANGRNPEGRQLNVCHCIVLLQAIYKIFRKTVTYYQQFRSPVFVGKGRQVKPLVIVSRTFPLPFVDVAYQIPVMPFVSIDKSI